jgi:hypothetical protein
MSDHRIESVVAELRAERQRLDIVECHVAAGLGAA